MIVLPEHKLIFLKAQKVAGTSFEIALSRYATNTSIITPITPKDEKIRIERGFRRPQNYRYGFLELFTLPKRKLLDSLLNREWPMKFYNHISAKEAKTHLGEKIWNSYDKISMVRNPFDYAVSYYFWANKTPHKRPHFEQWCLSNFGILMKNNDQYFIDNVEVIDYYIRYHELEKDILELEMRIPSLEGLWETFRSITAKSEFRPRKASISEMFEAAPKAKTLISTIYKNEIDRFQFAEP